MFQSRDESFWLGSWPESRKFTAFLFFEAWLLSSCVNFLINFSLKLTFVPERMIALQAFRFPYDEYLWRAIQIFFSNRFGALCFLNFFLKKFFGNRGIFGISKIFCQFDVLCRATLAIILLLLCTNTRTGLQSIRRYTLKSEALSIVFLFSESPE